MEHCFVIFCVITACLDIVSAQGPESGPSPFSGYRSHHSYYQGKLPGLEGEGPESGTLSFSRNQRGLVGAAGPESGPSPFSGHRYEYSFHQGPESGTLSFSGSLPGQVGAGGPESGPPFFAGPESGPSPFSGHGYQYSYHQGNLPGLVGAEGPQSGPSPFSGYGYQQSYQQENLPGLVGAEGPGSRPSSLSGHRYVHSYDQEIPFLPPRYRPGNLPVHVGAEGNLPGLVGAAGPGSRPSSLSGQRYVHSYHQGNPAHIGNPAHTEYTEWVNPFPFVNSEWVNPFPFVHSEWWNSYPWSKKHKHPHKGSPQAPDSKQGSPEKFVQYKRPGVPASDEEPQRRNVSQLHPLQYKSPFLASLMENGESSYLNSGISQDGGHQPKVNHASFEVEKRVPAQGEMLNSDEMAHYRPKQPEMIQEKSGQEKSIKESDEMILKLFD